MPLWSTQIPNLPIKTKRKKERKKKEKEKKKKKKKKVWANFHFGSNFENFTNFPRKKVLFICQSLRFWGQNFRERGYSHGEEGRISQKLRENCEISHFKVENPQKWVTFWSKTSLELQEGLISQKLRENCKISHFWGRKNPQKWIPICENFGKKKPWNQPFFEGENS